VGRGLSILVLVVGGVACASGPPNWVREGQAGAPGVRRVLLCPPNLVLALPSEIHSGAAPIDRAIVEYFEGLGREVDRLGLIEGRQLWKQSVAQAKAAGEIGATPAIFAARLAQDHEFDALVMPSLVMLQRRMDASNVSWDGVSRRLKLMKDTAAEKGMELTPLSGPMWVTSLHVLVFARDGTRVFEGRGGLDLLHAVDLVKRGTRYGYMFQPNRSLFQEQSVLRESVVLAFKPYLLPPDE
jgi:hypothetical protein